MDSMPPVVNALVMNALVVNAPVMNAPVADDERSDPAIDGEGLRGMGAPELTGHSSAPL
jgi:hypothetical protein